MQFVLHAPSTQGIGVDTSGIMHGLDDVELSWDPASTSTMDDQDAIAAAAAHGNVFTPAGEARPARVQRILQQPGGVLASTTQREQPANDYDPAFIPDSHNQFPLLHGRASCGHVSSGLGSRDLQTAPPASTRQ
jgi:hypothetical protein